MAMPIFTYESMSREELIRECKNKQAVINDLNERLDLPPSERGEKKERRCDFCGRSGVEIETVFGAKTKICGECVSACAKELPASQGEAATTVSGQSQKAADGILSSLALAGFSSDKQETPRTEEFYRAHPIDEYEQTEIDPRDGAEWLKFARQLERELEESKNAEARTRERLETILSARVLSAERAQELWPQAGTFHCACVFNRAEDFGEAKLVTACAYHSKLRAHDWQPNGGKVTWESHPGGEAPHVHTTCSKCGARAWFLEFHWELLTKGCSEAKPSYVEGK